MLVTDKKKTAGLFPQDPVMIFAPVQILSERIYPQRRILRWQRKFLCRQARMQLWCNLLVFGGFWLRHCNWMVMPTCDFHICCFPSEYSEDIRHMPSRIHFHGSQSNTDWLDSVRCSFFCSDPYKQRFWSPIGIVSNFFRIRCNNSSVSTFPIVHVSQLYESWGSASTMNRKYIFRGGPALILIRCTKECVFCAMHAIHCWTDR